MLRNAKATKCCLWAAAILATAILAVGNAWSQETAKAAKKVPAFPGAEGYGMWATGGRGGRVIEVTNLDDKGPGSLRDAVTTKGPRIVVFRVSGTIALAKMLRVGSDLTIAGQTAPGDGICLKDSFLDTSNAKNVIIRYLRVRPGDASVKQPDGLNGRNGENLIIDHCSASWSVDETCSFYGNKNITVQWCLVSESLWHSVHPKGNHGFGGIWGGNGASFHHNLLAHHTSRNPRIADEQENTDVRNNVIYNWGFNSCYGGANSRTNLVANYYKPGPATRKDLKFRILDGQSQGGKWYIADNFVAGCPTVSADNWTSGVQKAYAPRSQMESKTPFPFAPVVTQKAEEAYELILKYAGANLPKRDSLDARVIEEARTGTAKFGETYQGGGKGVIDSQKAVGGWPELKSAEPPADTDHDGMPDEWEKRYGLNPNDPSDGALDKDGDGYTNVEEYLNDTDPAQYVNYADAKNNVHSLHKETSQ